MQDGAELMTLVQWHAEQMQSALQSDNTADVFTQAYELFGQLRTSALSSRDYYELFTSVFDESRRLESWLSAESRPLQDWYIRAQYCYGVLPRLYLMVTIGAICVRTGTGASDMAFDLLNMAKGVQHPLRGLFLRYYLNKSLKEAFSRLSTTDSVRFFIENLSEMHRLWVRLSPSDELQSDKNELCVLLGENITRLSQLPGVTLSLYKDTVFPQLLAAIIDARDEISQSYLIDGVIHTFPDEYHAFTLGALLTTVEKYGKTDKLALADGLLDRLLLYAESETGRLSLLDTQADVVIKEFTETAILSTEVTEFRALKLVEKLLILLLKLQLNDDFRQTNEVLVTISTKFTMITSLNANPEINQQLSLILLLILQPGNWDILSMTSFQRLLLCLNPETRAEVSVKVVDILMTCEEIQRDQTELIVVLAEAIICNFPSEDWEYRQAAYVSLAKLMHKYATSSCDLTEIISNFKAYFAAVPEAILPLAPALVFLLSRHTRPTNEWYTVISQLLDFVYIRDHDFAVKLALTVTLMHCKIAVFPVVLKLLTQWKEESGLPMRLDTLLTVIGGLEVMGKQGVCVEDEMKACWEVVREIHCRSEQTKAMCAWARLPGISLSYILPRTIKTADMSSPFDLLLVLNLLLTLPTSHLPPSTLTDLLSLIRLQVHSKPEQTYLNCTLTYLQHRHLV